MTIDASNVKVKVKLGQQAAAAHNSTLVVTQGGTLHDLSLQLFSNLRHSFLSGSSDSLREIALLHFFADNHALC